MKNVFGTNLTLTLFGESHGAAVGGVLDGLAPGIPVDREAIEGKLALRRPQGAISTARAMDCPGALPSQNSPAGTSAARPQRTGSNGPP